MRIKLASLVVLFLIGCGDSDEPILPGIGPDSSQSVTQGVEYQRAKLGADCTATLFPATVQVSQNGADLTAEAGGQTVATGTIDAANHVQVTLISSTPSVPNLSCSGIFNSGSFDLSCPVGGGATCDFVYTRSDLM